MGTNWQIPPSGRKETYAFFLQKHCMVYLRYVIKDILKSKNFSKISDEM